MDTQPGVVTPRWLRERNGSEPIEHQLAVTLNQLSHREEGHRVTLTPETARLVRPTLNVCTNALAGSMVEVLPNNLLAASCPWSTIKEDVKEDCRFNLLKHSKFEEIEACQIWGIANSGEQIVSPIHNLRLSLKAAEATEADTISCPRLQ